MLLAERYEMRYSGITDEIWDRWETETAAPESPVIEIERSAGNVRAVLRGIVVKDQAGNEIHLISAYYHRFMQHDPFVGTPDEQALLAGEFMPVSQRRELAAFQQQIYAAALSWKYLKRNLFLNGLASETELQQLEVHYRFLSAYTHPSSEIALAALGGRAYTPRPLTPDHFANELVRLYVICISIRELRAFHTSFERPPDAGLRDWGEVETLIASAEAATSYFWFVGGTPHEFDRIQEANARGPIVEADGTHALLPREERLPEDIHDAEVPYYRQPLRRIIRMHQHQNEMTGFPYVSPWPTDDPLRRW